VADSRLEGVADAIAGLNQVGAAITGRELRKAVELAIAPALHRAASTMPQGTEPHKTYRGRLVAPGYALTTLHVETSLNKRTGAAYARLGVGREAFYAVQFVELGTAHAPAQPWLRPAFEMTEDEQLKILRDELKARAEKAAAKSARAVSRQARRGFV
jgi:HK97 gp10 family phage protein